MSEIEPIGAAAALEVAPVRLAANEGAPGIGFADMLTRGVAELDQKVATANDLVRAFATGEDVPIHQVTIALEEARLAVELAVQMRSRLIEGYREIMNMQL